MEVAPGYAWSTDVSASAPVLRARLGVEFPWFTPSIVAVSAFLDPGPLTPKLASYFFAAKRDILGHPGALTHAPTPAGLHRTDVHTEGGHIAVEGTAAQSQRATPKVATKELRTIDFMVAINQRLQHDIKYLIRLEPGVQSPEQTLSNLSGSCRDTGWLLVVYPRVRRARRCEYSDR